MFVGLINMKAHFSFAFFSKHLKLQATFVKLLLRQNHNDRQNPFNQVGLMGINIYGVKSNPSGEYDFNMRRDSRKEVEAIVSRRKDLAFVMYTDKDVAEVTTF